MNRTITLEMPESTASGWGYSLWKTYHSGCVRRRLLGEERGGEYSFDAMVGSFFHKMMEHYYEDGITWFECVEDSQEFEEAYRLFKAYAERFPHDFGKLEHQEVFIEDDGMFSEDGVVGVTPFTGRIDMVRRFSEKDVKRAYDLYGIVIEPGLYLEDFKTHRSKSNLQIFKDCDSIQFNAYMMLWNHLNEEQCKGMIAHHIIRHKYLKDYSFEFIMVSSPDEETIENVRAYFKRANEMKTLFGTEKTNFNLDDCFSYNKVCPFREYCRGGL